MNLKKSIMIGLMAVSGSLVPSVASALNIDNNSDLKKEIVSQNKSNDYVTKQVDTLITTLNLENLSFANNNQYGEKTNDKSKDFLDFMKGLYQSKEVSSIFKYSPKKDSLIFSNNSNYGAFAFAFDTSCLVNIGIKENGMTANFEKNQHLDSHLSEKMYMGEKDKNFYNEFVARHEISHCRFNDYANPLVISADQNINSFVNAILRDSPTLKGAPIAQMMDESYADSLAGIQMMVKYGVNNPELNNFLNKFHANRESTAIEDHQLSAEKVHDTHHGLKLILTQDYKDRISQLSSEDGIGMEKIALEVANKALVYKITQFDNQQHDMIFNMDNIKKSAIDNVSMQIFKESPHDFKRSVTASITKMSSSDNAITEIAKDYIQTMKNNGTFENYKKALITVTYNASDSDNGYSSKMQFLLDRNKAQDTIKKEQINLGNVLNEKIKEKTGSTATDMIIKIVSELKAYDFKPDIVSGKESETIKQRALENLSDDNLKSFKFPKNIAEKLDKIHQNIIRNGLEDNIASSTFKLKQ